MEGNGDLPAGDAAAYERAHPEYDIHPDFAGHWFAWKQTADEVSGELTHADSEGELVAKLEGDP